MAENQIAGKLGKKPAQPAPEQARKFSFSALANATKLPKPPRRFGHEDAVGSTPWGMLGNDRYGCCVFAGAAHETMLWSRTGEAPDASFTAENVLSDYSAVTGFNPADPNTDQGTDMRQAADYRRKVGVVDSSGTRHKVAAFLTIPKGDIVAHYQALYLFGAVAIGFRFPASAMDQFNRGKRWNVVRGSEIDGGHYVPLVAKRGSLECVTWGKVQPLTVAFLERYNDESIVYISEEALTARKSPEGFDYDTLVSYLSAL